MIHNENLQMQMIIKLSHDDNIIVIVLNFLSHSCTCTIFSLHILLSYGHHKFHKHDRLTNPAGLLFRLFPKQIYTTERLCLSECFLWRKSRWPHWIHCYLLRHMWLPQQHLFWHGIMMVIKQVYVLCICQDVCCHFGRWRKKPGKINILNKETVMRTSLLSKHMERVRRADFLQLSTHHAS